MIGIFIVPVIAMILWWLVGRFASDESPRARVAREARARSLGTGGSQPKNP